MATLLGSHSYPLHFIDFEASRLAIPYHVGMRPYEIAAFQWSCHTIREPGGPIEHSCWLNAEDAFPNFKFASSLHEFLGDEGTLYIWSPYERVVLNEVHTQMEKYGHDAPALAHWLEDIASPTSARVVDLCALAKEHYFHPGMKGSLSIKYVLPAVWGQNPALWEHQIFSRYVRQDANGRMLNPYETLPPLPIGEKDEVVHEGTGAMRVYQDMMFGVAKHDPAVRESYRTLLLQYCELDTAAMAMIWLHWSGL